MSDCLYIKNGEIIVKFESYYTNGKGPKNWMGLSHPPTFQGRHYGTIGPNFLDLLKLPQKVPYSRRKQMDFETPSFKTPPMFHVFDYFHCYPIHVEIFDICQHDPCWTSMGILV